jgi:hypothetical protein
LLALQNLNYLPIYPFTILPVVSTPPRSISHLAYDQQRQANDERRLVHSPCNHTSPNRNFRALEDLHSSSIVAVVVVKRQRFVRQACVSNRRVDVDDTADPIILPWWSCARRTRKADGALESAPKYNHHHHHHHHHRRRNATIVPSTRSMTIGHHTSLRRYRCSSFCRSRSCRPPRM